MSILNTSDKKAFLNVVKSLQDLCIVHGYAYISEQINEPYVSNYVVCLKTEKIKKYPTTSHL